MDELGLDLLDGGLEFGDEGLEGVECVSGLGLNCVLDAVNHCPGVFEVLSHAVRDTSEEALDVLADVHRDVDGVQDHILDQSHDTLDVTRVLKLTAV